MAYFKRSCELGRWAKTIEFDDVEGYPIWNTINNRLGSKSNVIDMVCYDLKKDKMPKEYRKIIKKHFGKEHTGVFIIQMLSGIEDED